MFKDIKSPATFSLFQKHWMLSRWQNGSKTTTKTTAPYDIHVVYTVSKHQGLAFVCVCCSFCVCRVRAVCIPACVSLEWQFVLHCM